jgi:phosphate transport system substrate-binding protein
MHRRSKLAGAGTLLLSLATLLAACGSSPSSSPAKPTSASTSSASSNVELSSLEKPPATKVSLTEAGSTLLLPLFQAWAPAVQQAYSTISVTPSGGGSGTGISEAISGAVDIGASDAYLSPADVQANPGLLNIPLAISAQQINYNVPGVSGNLRLSGAVISDIYQGKITNWDAPQIKSLNPGVNLPNLTIVPIHRSDGSGDTFIFTQYLSKADPNGWGKAVSYGTTVAFPPVPGSLAENGNSAMVTGCQAAPGCIAYIGISYLSKTRAAGLGQAQIDNASGQYELPDPATISQAAASFTSQTPPDGTISMIDGKAGYPIINYEYAIVKTAQPDTATAQAVRTTLAWAVDPTKGGSSAYLGPVDFEPLPSKVVQQSANQMAKIQ